MSTIAIVILVAIGLMIMMGLNERTRDQLFLKEKKDYIPSDKASSLAGYIVRHGGSLRYHCSHRSGVPRHFLAPEMTRCERLNCSDDHFRVPSI